VVCFSPWLYLARVAHQARRPSGDDIAPRVCAHAQNVRGPEMGASRRAHAPWREKPLEHLLLNIRTMAKDTEQVNRSPKALYQEAQQLYEQALAKEREAIRAALEAASWLVKPAAGMLEIPHTTLVRMLTGRHKELNEEVEEKRAARKYATGNPSRMRPK
jgi:transcriptional regulator with GAF, ATPase, and Fis domain